MKGRLIGALVVITFLIVVGCTACDPEGVTTTLDLTREAGVLTATGWVADQEYKVANGDQVLEYLIFKTDDEILYSIIFENKEEGQLGTTTFKMPKEGAVTLTCPELGECTLKVTASEESLPTLTITKEGGEKMYFSMIT